MQGQPYFLSLLGEAYGGLGRFSDGLRCLDEALSLISRTRERWLEPECYRVKGELLLQAAATEKPDGAGSLMAKAEDCLLQAGAISRSQGAKALELRAAISLSRLWRDQKKTRAAYRVLSGVYTRFCEGWNTPDLELASALREQLGRSCDAAVAGAVPSKKQV